MPRPLLRLTILTAALLLGGAAVGQDRPAGPPPAGSPGDGPPDHGMRGGRLYISPAGEPFRGPEGLKLWFDGADNNHDGALSLAEFRSDFIRYFKILDANGDGVIDGAENAIYENRIAPEITILGLSDSDGPPRGMGGGRRGGMPGGGGHGGGMGGDGMDRGGGDAPRGAGRRGGGMPRREGAARFSLLDIPQPIRGADANLDWKVSAAEWAKAAGQRFALLDTDDDGKLTLDTLPSLPGQGLRGERRSGREDRRGHQEKPPRN